jgi:hypothetical protein
MLARKAHVGAAPPAIPPHKQLELLYARRLAIDSLIESLVTYDRVRAKAVEILKQKSA